MRIFVGVKIYLKNYCVAVDEGVDSDFPNVVKGIADTVDKSVFVTADKIMGV